MITEVPAWIAIGMWFVFQVVSSVGDLSGQGGGVAYAAHIGGLVCGLVAGAWLGVPQFHGEPAPRRVRVLAAGATAALGVPMAAIERGLEALPGVPGRFERASSDADDITVIVDYAHTPDALERALAACREHTRGRVLAVFGCGGDRDRGKRPIMGEAAARGADRAWVTNDNPRSEDPAAIAAQIVAGAPSGALTVELDRRAAIAAAIAEAAAGDIVLVAGKGHETTQTVGTQVLPFDDRVVARELLIARAGAGAR